MADWCNCEACHRDGPHTSDCAVHNEPYSAPGNCDCDLGCHHVLGLDGEWTGKSDKEDD